MTHSLTWLDPDEPFPPVSKSWDQQSPAPGLLAAGASLEVWRLKAAYANGIFPWFSQGQPILWWSPDPRMVLFPQEFRLHRSLAKLIKRFRTLPSCEVRVDSDFSAVIHACSTSPRSGQNGTWIVPAMIEAYEKLHEAGVAHSVETWVDGELVGGLYCIAIGRAVFGESMFARRTDASKVALAALVGLCRTQGVDMIDCQQNTAHLASLGAREITRAQFLDNVLKARSHDELDWSFKPVYWDSLLSSPFSA
ncbi:leucyl/phenylalanyl-tRNA--protein transferase [Diaphorobacter aerolatus]|uniref:Leucyl/phenylalanyl-tRNA--protein transferase n=1 Tax=Diaphorobacter aerolatus TaxID=1288495 RepID=A0A7H0GL38_9BURK|nr:leucyl/phenylalanyl-tRNA--protein transferase [Diaphorobacter aerolatus]QNP49004.1 leucyl/phenylalanyl-tRNA--protein transferase [Diaphorobacter aerolatus]